ncbi:unnamed protein product [Acanthoscelides obtectus]|uniref:Uncharacterized protein n=1 Tax=Acanthoscelides obtectus TaxID=200917 RepID=A0A9P0MIH3_ACAOB|nr:unnamed protein product [Acanthoscelides obtectus]CAK1635616.1 hypothetical protein AOBTE_LOCUS9388 [Acanthoscelides obtectus]
MTEQSSAIHSPRNTDFDECNSSDVNTEEEHDDEGNERDKDEENENFRTPKAQKRVNEEKISFKSKKRKKQLCMIGC